MSESGLYSDETDGEDDTSYDYTGEDDNDDEYDDEFDDSEYSDSDWQHIEEDSRDDRCWEEEERQEFPPGDHMRENRERARRRGGDGPAVCDILFLVTISLAVMAVTFYYFL